MALDVQWLRTDNSASQCLVGALRNGYLWAGDANNSCMGAIETPLSALSCVTAWHSSIGSYAAAAGQGSTVLFYSIGCKPLGCSMLGEAAGVSACAVPKKMKKKVRPHGVAASRMFSLFQLLEPARATCLQVGMQHVSAGIKPAGCVYPLIRILRSSQAAFRQLQCGMRAVNSIAFASSASLLFVAGTCNDVEIHALTLQRSSD
jgi:hypothetical protein